MKDPEICSEKRKKERFKRKKMRVFVVEEGGRTARGRLWHEKEGKLKGRVFLSRKRKKERGETFANSSAGCEKRSDEVEKISRVFFWEKR